VQCPSLRRVFSLPLGPSVKCFKVVDWNARWPPTLKSGIGPVSGAGGVTVGGGGRVGLGCTVPASQGTFDDLSGRFAGSLLHDTSIACELSFNGGQKWNEFRLALFRVLYVVLPHDVRFQLVRRGFKVYPDGTSRVSSEDA
jgi:hypothetical protein